MTRVLEALLLAAPLLAYLQWRLLLARGVPNPSRRTLLGLAVAVAVMGAWLAWTALSERHPYGSHYVPATLQDGRIVPGHGA